MTGPEHYREAERLLREPYANDATRADATVHAILAVAAAVALNDRMEGMSVEQLAEWLSATGELTAVNRG